MKPVKVPGFTGINNKAPADRLPKDEAGRQAVSDAVNVDLTDAGTFQRRPGSERIITATGVRGLTSYGAYGYYAAGDTLYRFDGFAPSEAVATLTSAHASICYAESPIGLVWSDGYRLNLLNGTSQRLAPAQPNPVPVASGVSGGSIPAGTYGVLFTSLRSDAQQSAPTYPQYVDVPANGSISISAAGHTDKINVFVTACNGELFYREATIDVGQSSATIPLVRSDGQSMAYEVMGDLPAGSILALHKGRLLSADGAFVFYSLPWAMGIYRPATDYIPFPQDVTVIAPVEGGVYIATLAETYWIPGGDISKAGLMVKKLPYGAVRGTLAKIEDSTDLMWFTPQGPVRASQDGQVVAMHSKSVAFPSANAGASIWRESNGLTQLISAISSNPSIPPGAAVAGSYMDAEVIKP